MERKENAQQSGEATLAERTISPKRPGYGTIFPVPLFAFLAARRERRARIDKDASDLLTFLGDMAYPEARNRARECRAKRDGAGDRHWSKVAVEITRRTGHVIARSPPTATKQRRSSPPRLRPRRRARYKTRLALLHLVHREPGATADVPALPGSGYGFRIPGISEPPGPKASR